MQHVWTPPSLKVRHYSALNQPSNATEVCDGNNVQFLPRTATHCADSFFLASLNNFVAASMKIRLQQLNFHPADLWLLACCRGNL